MWGWPLDANTKKRRLCLGAHILRRKFGEYYPRRARRLAEANGIPRPPASGFSPQLTWLCPSDHIAGGNGVILGEIMIVSIMALWVGTANSSGLIGVPPEVAFGLMFLMIAIAGGTLRGKQPDDQRFPSRWTTLPPVGRRGGRSLTATIRAPGIGESSGCLMAMTDFASICDQIWDRSSARWMANLSFLGGAVIVPAGLAGRERVGSARGSVPRRSDP